jgi:hypothetical protein
VEARDCWPSSLLSGVGRAPTPRRQARWCPCRMHLGVAEAAPFPTPRQAPALPPGRRDRRSSLRRGCHVSSSAAARAGEEGESGHHIHSIHGALEEPADGALVRRRPWILHLMPGPPRHHRWRNLRPPSALPRALLRPTPGPSSSLSMAGSAHLKGPYDV